MRPQICHFVRGIPTTQNKVVWGAEVHPKKPRNIPPNYHVPKMLASFFFHPTHMHKNSACSRVLESRLKVSDPRLAHSKKDILGVFCKKLQRTPFFFFFFFDVLVVWGLKYHPKYQGKLHLPQILAFIFCFFTTHMYKYSTCSILAF